MAADVQLVAKQSKKHKLLHYKHTTKADPLQTWSGQFGFRKLRFPEFMTTAHEDGKFVSFTHRSHLPPGNPSYTFPFLNLFIFYQFFKH
jgi:hypothetical protein